MNYANFQIMVIDDDEVTRSKIVVSLRDLGFTGVIYQAINGQEALTFLNDLSDADKTIDLIICDIVMPIMNGVEVLTNVRSGFTKFKFTPFLMLTSRSDRELVVACVKQGADQYLIKPWDNKSLLAKILAACKKKDV